MKAKTKIKRCIGCILCGVMLTGLLAGCGSGASKETKGENEISCWMPITSNMSLYTSNFGETELAKELEKRTEVKVNYIHPPLGQESEKFSILVASTELPDIIEYNWATYPGGPGKAIKEGIIVDIGKYRDKAVNLFDYLEANKEIYRMVATDNKEVFSFPFIRGDKSLGYSSGLMIRGDWLKELNLEVPRTISEWETVLTAFKDKKGIRAPFSSLNVDFFASGFDTTTEYYVEDGKVKFGPLDPTFKDYLVAMRRWYQSGLIDRSFTTLDGPTKEANILNGFSGSTSGSIGSGIGKWMASAKTEGYSLEPAPFPTSDLSHPAKFGVYQIPVTPSGRSFDAISTSCKNIDAAIKFLDYGYGEEGRMLYNFGIEGVSYEMIDGYPTYTDLIVKNPENKSMTVALSNYARSYDAGPFIQDKRYMEQYASLDEQKRALEVWSQTDASEHTLPNLYVKAEELNEYAQLNTDVDTYVDEMIMKFIIGAEPIENFDKMIEQLHKRGVDRLLEIRQSAYDRHMDK